jgi:hypothetical protein
VLGGSSATNLQPLRKRPRYSFETQITLHKHPSYVAVQALGAHGHVLGTSAAQHV